jgi:hypothetical protein
MLRCWGYNASRSAYEIAWPSTVERLGSCNNNHAYGPKVVLIATSIKAAVDPPVLRLDAAIAKPIPSRSQNGVRRMLFSGARMRCRAPPSQISHAVWFRALFVHGPGRHIAGIPRPIGA